MMSTKVTKIPWAWELRSSPWYITVVVAIGGAVDLLVYALPVSFIPFRLQALGYDRTSSKAGWLLFAFSLSLILSTPFVSWWSEKYNSRRNPLIAGLVALIGSQALFMEARVFWLMMLARVLQGISSTVVWVLALALLCDSVPPDQIGRHMGITMMGYSCGLIVAAPLGGLLYGTLGYRAPFIFGMIAALIDLVGRVFVIEKSEADAIRASLAAQMDQNEPSATRDSESGVVEANAQAQEPIPRLPAWRIWRELGFRRRPVAIFMLTLVYGMVITAIEPSVPLRLHDVWELSPTKVGLIFLAATAPTIISGPLTGWLSDKYGAPLVAVGCLILGIPWLYPLTLSSKLAIFIVSLLFTMFFESGLVTPITVETAKLTETIPGVGYADTFGVFNIAYGSGSMLGPVIGGQLYDEHQNGWVLTCIVIGGLLVAGLAFAATIGEVPLALTAYRAVVPKAVTSPSEDQELEEPRVVPVE